MQKSNHNQFQKNFFISSASNALFTFFTVCTSVTMIQAFLAYRGVNGFGLGLIATVTNITQALSYFLCIGVCDKLKDIVKTTAASIVLQIVLPLILIALAAFNGLEALSLLCIAVIGVAFQNFVFSYRTLLVTKLSVYLVPAPDYGRFQAVTGVACGLVSILAGAVNPLLISSFGEQNGYTALFALAVLFCLSSGIFSVFLKPIDYAPNNKTDSSPFKAILDILKYDRFNSFAFIYCVRGIALGAGMMLLPLGIYRIGITSIQSTYVASAIASTTILGCLFYVVVARRIPSETLVSIGLVVWALGFSLCLLAKAFPFFIVGVFVTSLGQVLVDYCMPVSVAEIVENAKMGAYTAARLLLTALACTVSSFIAGIVIESRFNVLYFLVVIVALLCSTPMNYKIVKLFKQADRKAAETVR